jgi:hypothetical protein
VSLTPAGADIGLALNLSALSVGMALGAAVGGAVIEHGGLASLAHVGAAITTLALAVVVRQGGSEPPPFLARLRRATNARRKGRIESGATRPAGGRRHPSWSTR